MKRLMMILALLSGCTSIDYKDGLILGLEQMTVEEHFVDPSEIYARCSQCGQLDLTLPEACTCINFRTKHAVIWLPHGATQSTIEHERAHSRGYDHPTGELRLQFAGWMKKSAGNAGPSVQAAIGNETVLSKVGNSGP